MMAKNSDLNAAAKAKKDEFYTQMPEIEAEMKNYREHFEDKVIFCNCDDPFESNFFKYFALNFNKLKLKKLIATCYAGSPVAGEQLSMFDAPIIEEDIDKKAYKIVITEVGDENNDGSIDLADVEYLIKNRKNTLSILDGNGDFASEECIALLDEADIVCTNPPFSMFRKYMKLLMDHRKKFIIIGNINAVTYKEVFPLIMQNQVWLGKSIHSGDRWFRVPDDYPLTAATSKEEDGKKYVKVKGVRWFTNLDYKERHDGIDLYKKYTPEDYPYYVNYDAIEVSVTKDIPKDYYEEMGVPITFLDVYSPEQFEIVGFSYNLAAPIKSIVEPDAEYVKGGPRFYTKAGDKKYKRHYDRIVVRRK